MTIKRETQKASVLYVDDDQQNLESFKAVFRREYDVHLADSAKDAMNILKQTTIQVLITDQRMPEMSGSELLETLSDRYPDMLRFMLTGFSDFDPLVCALNDGRLQGYFSKPMDVDKIKERIEDGLMKYYLKQQNEELNASLQESEKRIKLQLAELEQVYAAAPVGLILVDRDLRIVRINEKLAEIDGLPVEDHLGKTLEEVLPELGENLKSIYQPVLDTGKPVINIAINGETPAQPGVDRDWLGSYFPFISGDGEIIGVIGGVIEITELKQAEKEAAEARMFAHNLLQTANAMIIGLDQVGCIQLINPMVEGLTGYTSDELIGKNWFETPAPRDTYPEAWEEFKRLMAGGVPHVFENPILTKDGEERIISWSNSQLERNGVLVGTLSVGIDITERRIAEKEKERLAGQLRQAQKMEAIGTLAGGIAHDFNNILSPIIGYAEIIMGDSVPDSDNHNNANEILNAGLRARDLTYQILTFSREREHEKKPVKIQSVIKEALKLLRASLPSNIELNQRIDEKCGPIMADPTQIYQVIMNLCTNAYQAMQDQKGRIDVVAEGMQLTEDDQPQFMEVQPGPFLRLSVSDTGPGIHPDLVERIFDPYFTTKRMQSGTGLGLSVVHGIVKSHGGAIKVYSELEEGTSFSVYLPRQIEGKISDTAAEESIAGGRESILLVDDEKAIINVVQKMLGTLGYSVTAFTDGREALADFYSRSETYDLVISDMTMPHLNGLQLAKEILAHTPNQPILICTGFSELINRIKVAETGIRGVVMKPIIKNEIAAAVREALDGS